MGAAVRRRRGSLGIAANFGLKAQASGHCVFL
jgi:hypothetical protein